MDLVVRMEKTQARIALLFFFFLVWLKDGWAGLIMGTEVRWKGDWAACGAFRKQLYPFFGTSESRMDQGLSGGRSLSVVWVSVPQGSCVQSLVLGTVV